MADISDAERRLLDSIHPVSRETLARLARYRALLETWQVRTNLVAPNTMDQFWSRHIADSLQLLAIRPAARDWLDLGSGGGFPGLVTAIVLHAEAGRNNPATGRYRLVESNRKKCAFMRQVAQATGTPVEILAERIESVAKRIAVTGEFAQVVTARALAPLPRLLSLAEPLLAPSVTGLFYKGRDYRRELEDCRGLWQFDLIIHESRIEAGSVVLEIRNPARRTA